MLGFDFTGYSATFMNFGLFRIFLHRGQNLIGSSILAKV